MHSRVALDIAWPRPQFNVIILHGTRATQHSTRICPQRIASCLQKDRVSISVQVIICINVGSSIWYTACSSSTSIMITKAIWRTMVSHSIDLTVLDNSNGGLGALGVLSGRTFWNNVFNTYYSIFVWVANSPINE